MTKKQNGYSFKRVRKKCLCSVVTYYNKKYSRNPKITLILPLIKAFGY